MVNVRINQIMDSTVTVTLLKKIKTPEGLEMRKFVDMKLVRSKVSLFSMSMNIMHVIDEQSPLWGMNQGACQDVEAEILVTTMGVDGTFGQPIHATHLYSACDIVWDKNFKDMLSFHPDGTREIDFALFNQLV